ncbi:MAG: hypothetical protein M1814_002598 [Vezdaea aestivalis]|nr:MAG: hypothetical protein M1814_002598 [Vezdaea aestivalis]
MPSVTSSKQGHLANLDHTSNTDHFPSSASIPQNFLEHSGEDSALHPGDLMSNGYGTHYPTAFYQSQTGNGVYDSMTNGHDIDLNVPPSNPNTLSPSPPSVFNHLSPSAVAGYTSDNGPSEHTTPSFNEDLVGVDFGTFPSLEDEQGVPSALGFYPHLTDHQPSLPTTGTFQSQPTTTSSYLLSPVHTNTSSPTNKAEELALGSSNHQAPFGVFSNNQTVSPVPTHVHVGVMQQTPALTGSSKSSSHDGNAQTNMHLTSPIVTVENYSRDESPARIPLQRNFSRRSRASQRSATHLSAHHPGDEPSSSDDEAEDQRGVLRRGGYHPANRDDREIPSLNDQDEHRQVTEKNEVVFQWLATSDAGSDTGDPPSPRSGANRRKLKNRKRAVSVGAPGHFSAPATRPDDSGIPGPGVLVDEDSEEDSREGDEEDPAGSSGDSDKEETADISNNQASPEDIDYFPTVQDEPSLSQFTFGRVRPWADGPSDSDRPQDEQYQPPTANQAMEVWRRRAAAVDTSSRVATWGTRRLSDTDIERFVKDGGILKRLSFSRDKQRAKPEKKSGGIFNTFLTKVPSNKRRGSEKSPQPLQRPNSGFPMRKDSESSLAPPPRSPSFPGSFGRKNPRLNITNAVVGISGQIAAVGSSGSISATANAAPQSPWVRGKQVIKRARSKSDLVRKTSSEGLSDLLTKHGGPPVPNLTSPAMDESLHRQVQAPTSHPAEEIDEEEDIEEEQVEAGVRMELNVRLDPIIPTAQGFLSNVQQLNPRLAPFLADRISHEQVGRYKRLVKLKIGHLNAVNSGACSSTAAFCPAFGGEARVLTPKPSQRETDAPFMGFQVPTNAASDDDEQSNYGEGAVAPAQFPQGVPLPPTKRLPAEFECPLCFKVKKFHKPSDWTKHVHEDVQPFTCTWARCTEPKSFKRKADWVRHENERHRKLEWWRCNKAECTHTCYRKDNFVQHLVREHKMPEPKIKSIKGGSAKMSATGKGKVVKGLAEDSWATSRETGQTDIDQLWSCVEQCHHDTTKRPQDEPCKFCGNVCSTWKKLTVHLARHMEQVSLPVLALVDHRQVTSDTLISPIGQPIASISPISPEISTKTDPFSSPFNSSVRLSVPQRGFPAAQSVSPPVSHVTGPYGFQGTQEFSSMAHMQQQLPSGFLYSGGTQQHGLPAYDSGYGAALGGSSYVSVEGPQQRVGIVPSNDNRNFAGVPDENYVGHQARHQLGVAPPAVTSYPSAGGAPGEFQPQASFHTGGVGHAYNDSTNSATLSDQQFDFGFGADNQVPFSQAPDGSTQGYSHPNQQPY